MPSVQQQHLANLNVTVEKFIKGGSSNNGSSPGWNGTDLQNQNQCKMLSKTPLLQKSIKRSEVVAYPAAASSKLTASLSSNANGRALMEAGGGGANTNTNATMQ